MIQVNNLSFHYQGVKRNVFNDFNMTLKENNIYGLLGKNGTGKSTLLYLVSGLLRQQQGTILIDGVSSCDRRPDVLRDIFIVTEEFFLPNVSLDVYVKMNRPFYPNFSQEVLDRCLQDFELPLSLNLNELPMGQKKKAYMSFALATGTKYLFMDEPTNGLDIPSKSQFRKVIANNMTDERMLIISTHQVHDIESLSTTSLFSIRIISCSMPRWQIFVRTIPSSTAHLPKWTIRYSMQSLHFRAMP